MNESLGIEIIAQVDFSNDSDNNSSVQFIEPNYFNKQHFSSSFLLI